jgi:hypothetical protein
MDDLSDVSRFSSKAFDHAERPFIEDGMFPAI